MELIETIRQFFHGKRYEHLNQDETEAFVDALCYMIAADGRVADVERQRLSDELDDIDWNGERDIESFIGDSLKRAETRVERGEDPELYARSIGDRISDQDVQEDIYLFAAKIATADRELAENEQALLAELVQEFDIPKETLEDVTGWIIYESDLQTDESIPAESQPSDDQLRKPDESDDPPEGGSW